MDLEISVLGIEIETKRLLLRPIRITDVDEFYAFASVEGVGEAAGWPHHKSKKESFDILSMLVSDNNIFAMVYKDNGKVIGTIGFHKSWANEEEEFLSLKSKELGYVLSMDYWGRGLMVEAVNAVIDYFFNKTELEAITVAHFIGNDRSKRVIEKCGFKFYKESTYFAYQLDKEFADRRYILLKPKLYIY